MSRYICVCHSVVAKKLCTITNVVRAIIVVYAASFVSQLTRFVELRYAPIRLSSLLNDDSGTADNTSIPGSSPSVSSPSFADDVVTSATVNSTAAVASAAAAVVGCGERYAPFVAENMNVYFNVYFWFRVIFIHLIPCSVLIILNALLVHTMRTAQRRRRQLLAQNRKSECRRLAESNMTTLMLVAVVGVFLLAEVPLAVMMIAMIINNTWDLQLIDDYVQWMAPLLLNLFILFSYPLNFFIYCAMSRQFRETFKGLCCGGSGRSGGDRNADQTTMYVTVGTECVNGGREEHRKTSRV
jgi:thyrotropin-releasing hormone receptor